MTGFKIEFDFDDRAFQAACDALVTRGRHLKPLMAEIGSELVRSTQDRFDAERAPDGTPWVDLRPATWARKRTTKKLQEYGDLIGGINFDAADDHVDVIADREYAAIQQLGGTSEMAPGPAAIPGRPFLGVSDDDAAMVLRAAQQYLADAIG